MAYPILAISSAEWFRIAVVLALGTLGWLALRLLCGQTAGTTLRAVWWWSTGILGLLLFVELVIALGGAPSRASWVQFARYCAGVATFCPLMALLGAKRPQDRAWQAIVLSLWVILLLPAIQWWLYPAGSTLEVWGAWQWFLGVLLLITLANYLPTRFSLAVVLTIAGQMILLRDYLPIGEWLKFAADGETESVNGVGAWLVEGGEALIAIGFLVAAAWLALWSTRRRRTGTKGVARSSDLVWRDFRDFYGVVWSLRVAGLMNSYAVRYRWPVTLTWRGFVRSTGDVERAGTDEAESEESRETEATILSPESEEALTQSFRTTLRRFVSPGWIEERLEPRRGSAAESRLGG